MTVFVSKEHCPYIKSSLHQIVLTQSTIAFKMQWSAPCCVVLAMTMTLCIVSCINQLYDDCHLQEAKAIGEDELPLVLPPTQDFQPSGRAESPLAKITDWVHTTDPATGLTLVVILLY